MDLLKAEIERKRKAKADEFGGSKYVKRSRITEVRRVAQGSGVEEGSRV